MADQTAREAKLVQYLNEAYGKEKQLETVLQAQIKLAQKPQLKKRLQDHLKETKAQARGLQKRIKELNGKADASSLPGPDVVGEAAASVANKAIAVAKGPVTALRGTSPADNQLRNVRDAFWNEAEEIAHYNTIEAFADQLGDKETVKLAKEFRRQEERMQSFLEKQIPQLVREVIKQEVPAKERKPAGASTTRRRSTASRSSSRSSGSSSRSTGSSSRSTRSSGSSSRTSSGSSNGSTRASSSRSGAKRSSGSSSRARSGSGSRSKSS